MRAWGLPFLLLLSCPACDRAEKPQPRSSVTVHLPPARPADAKPGFTFEDRDQAAIG
jgi:hypothetical protein